MAFNHESTEIFDVAIVGAGLSGLATALSLLKSSPTLRIAVIGPRANFASNQPGIATHPNFSLDHNFLSQWTAYTLPLADDVLSNASAVNNSVCLARGRWQVAKDLNDAQRIQALSAVFNAHVPERFHGQWLDTKANFGALWMPSAWAVSPKDLRQVWEAELTHMQCQILDSRVTKFQLPNGPHSTVTLFLESSTSKPVGVSAKALVLCNPAGLHRALRFNESDACALPLVQWPGQSKLLQLPNLHALYGKSTVQTNNFSIPITNNDWLVRDESPQERTEHVDVENADRKFLGDRWHAPDRMPFLGRMFDLNKINTEPLQYLKYEKLPLPEIPNVYLNLAHGSRGLLGSIGGAQVITQLLLGTNTCLPEHLKLAVAPNRYVARHLREQLQSPH
jgi:glycine/D-amino acid oxidase-like deaminating enzyme